MRCFRLFVAYFCTPDFADKFAYELIEYNKAIGKSPETIERKIREMDEKYRVSYKKAFR
jgi:hypothetical protein